MSWAYVPNTNQVWQYEDTATAADTYSDAVGSYSGGIRTQTFAGGNERKTYVRCRTKADEVERGELSWNYFNPA